MNTRFKRFWAFWLALAPLVVLLCPGVADACPNCKDGLYENYLAMAFGCSVLFMLAMPFSIMGAWLIYFLRVAKQNNCEQQTPELYKAEPS